jgi:hypothetical protein
MHTVYGAATLNNTLVLGLFLWVVWARQLPWVYSSEVTVIVACSLLMGALGWSRSTFKVRGAVEGGCGCALKEYSHAHRPRKHCSQRLWPPCHLPPHRPPVSQACKCCTRAARSRVHGAPTCAFLALCPSVRPSGRFLRCRCTRCRF